MNTILGIDVGATGIKGALVDIRTGELASDRIKYATPKPATKELLIDTAYRIVEDLDWAGKPVGIGFPAIIKNGIAKSASNIDKEWLNTDALQAFKSRFGTDEVALLNDADAAGVAEMTFGKGREAKGTVILITIGTGIGSAIFRDGNLLPNTELGHLLYKKSKFEKYMANSVRERKELSWKSWGKEVNVFLEHIDFLFAPDLILVSGGVSKKFAKYEEYINPELNVVPAQLLNNAGIIGAAIVGNRLKSSL